MRRALLWCLLANVISGTSFVAMDRGADSGLPTITFTFFRTALSSLLFLVVGAWRGELKPRFSARDWGLVLLVAGPGFVLPLVLGVRGVALSTPGIGSILALVEPIAIVPLSVLFLRERPGRDRLLGIAIGLVGALFVVWSDDFSGATAIDPKARLGNVLLAIQGGAWAIYTVAGKPVVERHPALTLSLWSTVLGCLLLGLLAPLEWKGLRPPALDGVADAIGLQEGVPAGMTFATAFRAAIPPAVYLGVFGSFLAVLLWNAGLQGVSAIGMAVFVFVQPAVGLVLNQALGERPPALFAWIGLALILGAVFLVSRPQRDASARASA